MKNSIVKSLLDILIREANYFEDTSYITSLLSINLDKKEDREFLKGQFETMRDLFDKGIKELNQWEK